METFVWPAWPAPDTIRAASTTRQQGGSEAPFDSFNLGAHVGDDPAAVRRNRALLRERLGLPSDPLWLRQVHGCRVVETDHYRPDEPADAAVVRQPGSVAAVLTADCLPVLLCARNGGAAAAAHAGWRGLAAGVLEATVAALGIVPGDILAWIGPGIGADKFEVGEEVREAFVHSDREAAALFRPSPAGRWLADLSGLARRRLQSVGVEAVFGGSWCTYSDTARFYSYRRQPRTGRMATLVWLQ